MRRLRGLYIPWLNPLAHFLPHNGAYKQSNGASGNPKIVYEALETSSTKCL
jgi:hypothetical protein